MKQKNLSIKNVGKKNVEKYYNYLFYSCLLKNPPKDRSSYFSSFWFDREKVEPLRVGDEVTYYSVTLKKDRTTLITGINLEKEYHPLILLNKDAYNQICDGDICRSKIKFDDGTLIDNPYKRRMELWRYNLDPSILPIVRENDKEKETLLATKLFLEVDESGHHYRKFINRLMKWLLNNDPNNRKYKEINYATYYNTRTYTYKTNEEKKKLWKRMLRKNGISMNYIF